MAAKRLLIVDDEPRFAAFVERVASRLDRRQRPDTIVLDMVMPDIDGNELILWLVDQRCRADIIIITGYHPDYAVNARLLAEMKGLRSVLTLSKPVSISRLRAALLRKSDGVSELAGDE